jgi:hypothetical protein
MAAPWWETLADLDAPDSGIDASKINDEVVGCWCMDVI